MRKRIYLCSRVAPDAREKNEAVAQALERNGYEVFVPHRQAYNKEEQVRDKERKDAKEVFENDFNYMQRTDICVAVSTLGRDCGWELGWFTARGVPIVYVPFEASIHLE